MYHGKTELHHMIKNMTKSKLPTEHAEAIAQEIQNATSEFHSNKTINIKLDRVVAHVDAKLYKVKAELLKWFLGTSLIQFMFHFSITHWGL